MDPNAPAAEYEDTVRPEWIDLNDHMNLAFYVLVFERALEALRARLDLAAGLVVSQMHTVYEREVTLGDRLRVVTHILDADVNRLHLFQEMFHIAEGYRAATLELVAGQDRAFAPAEREAIAALLERDPPRGAGRRIGLPKARS